MGFNGEAPVHCKKAARKVNRVKIKKKESGMVESLVGLIGGIALLFWGVYMVKTGMLRTFGVALQKGLACALHNRLNGFAAGFGLSTLLQSSTAAGLLVAGLQAENVVSTAIAISTILGAELGSAFVACVLSLNFEAFAPLFIAAGVIIFFFKKPQTREGQFGRILLGLGFIMVAIGQIVAATGPLRTAEDVLPYFEILALYPLLCFAGGALLALASLSSLAAVIVCASLVSADVLSITSGFWVVLGANAGSTLLSILTTLPSSRTGRRGPTGCAFYRVFSISAMAIALMAEPIRNYFVNVDSIVFFHLSFNALSGLIGLAFISFFACWAEKLLPTPKDATLPISHQELFAQENFVSPGVSFRVARKEMVKNLENLRNYWETLPWLLKANPNPGDIMVLRDRRESICTVSFELTQFLERVAREPLTDDDALLWQNEKTINAATRDGALFVEHIIEVIDREKCSKNREFSAQGLEELLHYHHRIDVSLNNIRTILATDSDALRLKTHETLMIERQLLMNEGFELTRLHMERVAKGLPTAVETSALHLELQTLFNRFGSMMIAAVTSEQLAVQLEKI